ncbi:MAG: hypothetical protein ACRDY0_00880 [Acidimicrobiales bacterium]
MSTVRDRTTVPIIKVARGVVFGMVAASAALAALVLVVVMAVRLNVYLPLHDPGRRVWVAYGGLGAIFVLAGAFSWRKRGSPK